MAKSEQLLWAEAERHRRIAHCNRFPVCKSAQTSFGEMTLGRSKVDGRVQTRIAHCNPSVCIPVETSFGKKGDIGGPSNGLKWATYRGRLSVKERTSAGWGFMRHEAKASDAAFFPSLPASSTNLPSNRESCASPSTQSIRPVGMAWRVRSACSQTMQATPRPCLSILSIMAAAQRQCTLSIHGRFARPARVFLLSG